MGFRCFGAKVCALVLLCLTGGGCASHAIDRKIEMAEYAETPRELDKMALPTYRAEPPDILLIDAVSNIRPADSPLKAGDTVTLRLQGGLPIDVTKNAEDYPLEYQYELEREIANKIINGDYLIGAEGTIDLGPAYGAVSIEGLTLEQARQALMNHFQQSVGLKNPSFTLLLPDVAGRQAITGEHLIRPDGTVSLGIYGSVFVSGLTLPEIKAAVEAHLSTQIHRPEVTVDVLAYNSKVYYVIMDGGGYGEQVLRLPCTGNETVLDAISQVYGLSQVSSKKIWVSRPGPSEYDASQVLDVHWRAITREGITTTNYQLFPGDRIYVQADHLMATDIFLGKVLAPLERIFGVTALGTGVVSGVDFYTQQGTQGGP
jgi:polysaccharide export outer membrane protein